MNKVQLFGRLVRDPETRYTDNGKVVCKFTVAAERPKLKGQQKADADFISCVAFGKTAEAIGNYFSKGSRILISDGTIHTGSYQNKEGKTVYTTDIWVNNFEFVDARKGNNSQNNNQSAFNNMGEEIDF